MKYNDRKTYNITVMDGSGSQIICSQYVQTVNLMTFKEPDIIKCHMS